MASGFARSVFVLMRGGETGGWTGLYTITGLPWDRTEFVCTVLVLM